MMTNFRLTALSRLFPTAGFQIITEQSSTEDFPSFEIGELSIAVILAISRPKASLFPAGRAEVPSCALERPPHQLSPEMKSISLEE
jgi:hypothetical protein